MESSLGEIIIDLFAEFLWHNGKIRINPKYESDDIVVELINKLENEIYIHPDLALYLSSCINPYFALQINKLIESVNSKNNLKFSFLEDKTLKYVKSLIQQ